MVLKKYSYFLAFCLVVHSHSRANQELTIEEKNARNSTALVYGLSQDGTTKMLLAYDKRGFWTPPGGGIKDNQTSRDAVIQELFEESAAFPEFDPCQTKKIVNNIPSNKKLCYHGHTMLYSFPISGIVESYDIGNNWKTRVKNRTSDFKEMTNWHWLSLDDLKKELKQNTTYKMPNYVLNSLQEFDQKIGLDTLKISKKTLFNTSLYQDFYKGYSSQNICATELFPLIFQGLSIEEALAVKKNMKEMNIPQKTKIATQNYNNLKSYISKWENDHKVSVKDYVK
jgi:hypothetical protein